MATAGQLLSTGNLDEAIQAATAQVKAKPKDLEVRWLLAELLILAGQHDRADTQFDAIIAVEPRAALSAIPIRHLLRAEAARRQFYDEGRVPELLDGVDQQVRDRLEAFVLLRAGKAAEAGRLVERAEKARPALAGKLTLSKESERGFTYFRDLDDITAEVF